MNINNKNFKTYDVYRFNTRYPSQGYSRVGTIQCLDAPMEQLLAYATRVFTTLRANEVYVVANQGELPIYKVNQTMNNLKINSVSALLESTKANGFIVGSFNTTNGLSFSAEPAVHATAALARQEAKRLAGINPGKYFIFVQIRGGEFVQPLPTSTSF